MNLAAADRALAMGLVNSLRQAAHWTPLSLLAQRIAENGPMAVKVSKAIVKASRDWSDDGTWANQNALTQPVFTSEDAHGGRDCFCRKAQAGMERALEETSRSLIFAESVAHLANQAFTTVRCAVGGEVAVNDSDLGVIRKMLAHDLMVSTCACLCC